jgi:CheY-like chemotaxis protein
VLREAGLAEDTGQAAVPEPLSPASAPVSAEPPDRAVVREVLSASPALRRARRMHGVLSGSRILWIDDRPELAAAEERTLESLGVEVLRATDTVPALELLSPGRPRRTGTTFDALVPDKARRTGPQFDAILSDIARPDSRTAGIDALPLIRQLAPETPVIFYVDESEARASTPAGAFGITNDPEELLHLILDVLERKRM